MDLRGRAAFAALLLKYFARVASQRTLPCFSRRELSFQLPKSIRVYEGAAQSVKGETFRAWRADIDLNDCSLSAWPSLASIPAGAKSPARKRKKLVHWLPSTADIFKLMANRRKLIVWFCATGKFLRPTSKKLDAAEKRIL